MENRDQPSPSKKKRGAPSEARPADPPAAGATATAPEVPSLEVATGAQPASAGDANPAPATPGDHENRAENRSGEEPATARKAEAPSGSGTRKLAMVPVALGGVVVALLGLLALMRWHADSLTNKVALSASAKPVTVVKAYDSQFQPTRTYVGTLEPWVEARVGPQFVSAYVDTVLVRPGAIVKKGAVLATLDCRSADATAQAIEMQARALSSEQKALADESARVSSMLDSGFVSPTEAETKSAQSDAKQAELLATRAKLLDTSLAVNDCVLRAPFDGEVGKRWLDPGAFVHPGEAIVSVVDRSTIRYVADVPEDDFAAVPPGKGGTIKIYATGMVTQATVARRAPSADPGTRTVHIEADLPDPTHQIPVYTTGELTVGVGSPKKAAELPLSSAIIKSEKAVVFVVGDDSVAHPKAYKYLGESGGSVYLDTSLSPGTLVVTEGRALLDDGDKVSWTLDPSWGTAPAAPPPSSPTPTARAEVAQ